MKLILKPLLKMLARATLRRYRPRVVGITGSVGKTSTKEAVAAVLASKYRVFQSPKNLNNELGLPLAVLGESDSGYGSLVAWAGIFVRAVRQLIKKNTSYPEVLVLEYGVDHPGDMAYLLSVAKPNVAVVTAVAPTHLEFLKTVAAVAREKQQLATSLDSSGVAVLAADDEMVAGFAERLRARVVTFGLSPSAQVRADAVQLSTAGAPGTAFKVSVSGSSLPVSLPGVLGRPPVVAALAAVAVGQALGVPLIEAVNALQKVVWPAGRLKVLAGVAGSVLIDDTYNSSPRAVAEALRVVQEVPAAEGARRWAILGDMLELGKASVELHREVGSRAAASGIDYLVTVGKESEAVHQAALTAGFNPQNMWHFAASSEVAKVIAPRLKANDIVLIKGSQGVRCELITKALLKNPEQAPELLVRQYKPWV
jgi:UDP-N-acetylmuramoyl-tripeptide--D-alanyl-D-alanine ligase